MMPKCHSAVLATLLIGFLLPAVVYAETITLVADEWPPFNGVPGSEEEGFLVDVAREVFEKQNVRVVYHLLPWRRAVDLTRSGSTNGLIGASRTDAPGFVFPAEELARNVIAFYVRKDSQWTFEQKSDIEGISLGVIAGYDYRQWLLDYIAAHRNDPEKVQVMTGHQPLERNIKKLLGGRVDAIVDNEAVILNVARRMGVSRKIKPAGYGTEPAYIYIAFSPALADSPRYAQLLSDGIVALRHSGRLAAILAKYGLRDWK